MKPLCNYIADCDRKPVNRNIKQNEIITQYLEVDVDSIIQLTEKTTTTTCEMKQSDITNEQYGGIFYSTVLLTTIKATTTPNMMENRKKN